MQQVCSRATTADRLARCVGAVLSKHRGPEIFGEDVLVLKFERGGDRYEVAFGFASCKIDDENKAAEPRITIRQDCSDGSLVITRVVFCTVNPSCTNFQRMIAKVQEVPPDGDEDDPKYASCNARAAHRKELRALATILEEELKKVPGYFTEQASPGNVPICRPLAGICTLSAERERFLFASSLAQELTYLEPLSRELLQFFPQTHNLSSSLLTRLSRLDILPPEELRPLPVYDFSAVLLDEALHELVTQAEELSAGGPPMSRLADKVRELSTIFEDELRRLPAATLRAFEAESRRPDPAEPWTHRFTCFNVHPGIHDLEIWKLSLPARARGPLSLLCALVNGEELPYHQRWIHYEYSGMENALRARGPLTVCGDLSKFCRLDFLRLPNCGKVFVDQIEEALRRGEVRPDLAH